MQYNKALRSPRNRAASSISDGMSKRNSAELLPDRIPSNPNSCRRTPQEQNAPLQSLRKLAATEKNAARFERETESLSFFVLLRPTSRRKFFIIKSTPLSLLVVYQLSGAEGATFAWQQNHPNRAKLRLQVKKQASRPQPSPPSAPPGTCGSHKTGAPRRLSRETMWR